MILGILYRGFLLRPSFQMFLQTAYSFLNALVTKAAISFPCEQEFQRTSTSVSRVLNSLKDFQIGWLPVLWVKLLSIRQMQGNSSKIGDWPKRVLSLSLLSREMARTVIQRSLRGANRSSSDRVTNLDIASSCTNKISLDTSILHKHNSQCMHINNVITHCLLPWYYKNK